MSSTALSDATWTASLARFLRESEGVEAVRVDPVARTVAVATIRDVDLVELEAKLKETLRGIEARFTLDNGGAEAVPVGGFTLHRAGNETELAAPTCDTAPKFWHWREFVWPTEVEAEADEEHEDHDHHDHDHHEEWRNLRWYALICGGFGLVGFGLAHAGTGPDWLSKAAYVIALVAGGWDPAKDSWTNVRKGQLDIHFLMLAVAVGATFIGAWSEATLLLFLFASSEVMEGYAMDRTHREVTSLLESSPKHARRIGPDGKEEEVPVESIKTGDRLRVRPGEAFAADGTIAKGKSASDESTLTGEAVPVEKEVGDGVFSGTLNLWGVIEFEVTKLPAESTLQKIIRLIQNARKLRAPSERFTDKFGGRYTLLVLAVCAVMFGVWGLFAGVPWFVNVEGTRSAFYRAMTLLVVMSPCALVLSIPSAILAAIAWGAKHGVLFRGGAAIEKLAQIDAVALDKTGTLTTGELSVERVESFPTGKETAVLELAYALEANSDHPLARAIVRYAKAQGVAEREVGEFASITGQGLRGTVDGAKVLLGRKELLTEGPLADWAKELPDADPEFAEVWVLGGDFVGRVLLRDEVRQESAGVLAELRRLGIRSIMLTGDRRHAAEKVAEQLGVDDVRAGLTPKDKVDAIQELRKAGHHIAMVGDGVNDAPSLAAADVSIAMGARGSDAALEQAEIILMHDRIENVLSALRLSRRATRIIRQNLAISLGVVVVMAIASLFGIVPLALGVAAHEGSTVVVCLNSLRLLFGKNEG